MRILLPLLLLVSAAAPAHAFMATRLIQLTNNGMYQVKYPTANSLLIQQGSAISAPENMYLNDAVYTTQSAAGTGLGDAIAGVIKFSGFGFSVPGGATIRGIQVKLRKYAGVAGGTQDLYVKLLKAGTAVGDNKASADYWPTSPVVSFYGGTADMWGTTWTPAEVNTADFGIQVGWLFSNTGNSEVVYGDYVQISIFY